MIKVFKKNIESNPLISYAINTLISEYDIKRCHPSTMYFIKGKEFYENLMSMDKLESNTLIGKMIREDASLYPKIEKIKVGWFNEFCEANNIKESNFISSTSDSILLVNKKPLKTVFHDGVVNFRNKDGEFTSYIRLLNPGIGNMEILFDGMSNSIRIKGINKEIVDANQVFIKLLKQSLSLLESSNRLTLKEMLRKANYIRNKYIMSKDPLMWASIKDKNEFVYAIDGERVLSQELLPESNDSQLVKTDNFVNLLLPILRLCFKPH